MKKWLLLSLTILLLAALSACAAGEVDSFQGTDECTGGTELTDVNIKEVSFQTEQGGGTLGISFVKGSRISGSGENSLDGVPQYHITVMEKPRRLRIDIEGVAYWDYYENMDAVLGDLITGYFDVAWTESGTYTLFLQLAENVQIAAEENSSGLQITMRTTEERDQDDDYFVILNAFEQYKEGLLDESLGLTPSYVAGMNRVVMVSQPIENMAEAEQQKAEIDQAIASTILGKEAYIEELYSGQLPEYDSNADQYDLETRAVVRIDGQEAALSWTMENATYLTTAQDGARLFYRTVQPDTTVDSEPVAQDVLLELESTGNISAISLSQKFYGIEKAAYSADGSYLAVLDSTEYGNALYVIDLASGTVRNMGEEGLGVSIADFTWSENGAVLYAMSGNGIYQLNQCDLSGENVSISAVEEQAGSDSAIDVAGGKLYFSDGNVIYQVDVSTGTRSEFAEGMEFTISPDKKYMAVKTYTDTGAEISTMDISLIDIGTGRSVDVVADQVVECMEFTGTGGALYVSFSNGNTDDYGYTIARVDVANTDSISQMEARSPQIAGDRMTSSLYIIDNIPVDDGAVPITYEYVE